jgi:hypothetical protein
MRRCALYVLGSWILLAGCNSGSDSSRATTPASTDAVPGTVAAPDSSETQATDTVITDSAVDSTTSATSTTSTTTVTTVDPTSSIPVDAAIAPATIAFTLPDGFEYPEGIAVDPETGRAYVTSTPSGAVAVAEPGEDSATVWLPAGSDGRGLTFGIEFDRDSVWLVAPPAIWEYGVDGALRGRHEADGGVLNDLAVTDDGVYVTDTANPVLWFLPRDSGADAPLVPIDFSMTQDALGEPFQLNGIEALDDGTLVAVHFFNGKLFHIDPHPPGGGLNIAVVDLGGYSLTVGDGMRAMGDVLWVTRGAAGDTVDRVALCPSHNCGTVTAGEPDPTLSFPTDVEIRGGELLVVNSQFDNGGGLGDGIPTKPFFVSAIPIFAS